MKTLAEQKKIVNVLKNELRNNKNIDEETIHQYWTELYNLDEKVKYYQRKLYYGNSKRNASIVFILFTVAMISLAIWSATK